MHELGRIYEVKNMNNEIISVFEQLATSTHHVFSKETLFKNQSNEIQEAIRNNNGLKLRELLSGDYYFADKTTVFQT